MRRACIFVREPHRIVAIPLSMELNEAFESFEVDARMRQTASNADTFAYVATSDVCDYVAASDVLDDARAIAELEP
jgi:hypothetical protein